MPDFGSATGAGAPDFGADLGQGFPAVPAAGYADPHAVRRLGKARLARLIWRWSHGAWAPSPT